MSTHAIIAIICLGGYLLIVPASIATARVYFVSACSDCRDAVERGRWLCEGDATWPATIGVLWPVTLIALAVYGVSWLVYRSLKRITDRLVLPKPEPPDPEQRIKELEREVLK